MSHLSTQQKALLVLGLVAAAFIPRLVTLGTIRTVDEHLWQSRGDQFIKAVASLKFDKTLVAGQPGITTAWLVGLAHPFRSLAADQAAIALVTAILVLITTYFLTRLWGFSWGMVAGFFLALDPFLLGHSRLVHTDALLALFFLTGLVILLAAVNPVYHRKVPVRRYLAFSAIATALAVLTKLFALIAIPAALAIITHAYLKGRRGALEGIRYTLFWLTILIAVVYVLWPALWLHADRVFLHLTERAALHAGGTRSQEITSMWWYYLREIPFRITPVTTLLLPAAAVGLLCAGRTASERISKRTSALLLLTGIGYATALSFSLDKSDRYILVTFLTLTLVSVFGLSTMIAWARRRLHLSPRTLLIIPAALIAFLAVDAVRLHPYYLAHYNRLYPVETEHKLGWGEGLERAAAWIAQSDPHSKVASYYSRVFAAFYGGPVDPLTHIDDSSAKYAVLYRSMFERGPDHPDTDLLRHFFDSGKPVHTVTINRLPYVWIFKRTASMLDE